MEKSYGSHSARARREARRHGRCRQGEGRLRPQLSAAAAQGAARQCRANKTRFERDRASLEARNAERRQGAAGISTKLDGKSFVILRQAGESGQLYGSVSTRDIAEAASGRRRDGHAQPGVARYADQDHRPLHGPRRASSRSDRQGDGQRRPLCRRGATPRRAAKSSPGPFRTARKPALLPSSFSRRKPPPRSRPPRPCPLRKTNSRHKTLWPASKPLKGSRFAALFRLRTCHAARV